MDASRIRITRVGGPILATALHCDHSLDRDWAGRTEPSPGSNHITLCLPGAETRCLSVALAPAEREVQQSRGSDRRAAERTGNRCRFLSPAIFHRTTATLDGRSRSSASSQVDLPEGHT